MPETTRTYVAKITNHGQVRDANRVERGLYVCESCETVMNADVNGAVNVRRKITQSPPTGRNVTPK